MVSACLMFEAQNQKLTYYIWKETNAWINIFLLVINILCWNSNFMNIVFHHVQNDSVMQGIKERRRSHAAFGHRQNLNPLTERSTWNFEQIIMSAGSPGLQKRGWNRLASRGYTNKVYANVTWNLKCAFWGIAFLPKSISRSQSPKNTLSVGKCPLSSQVNRGVQKFSTYNSTSNRSGIKESNSVEHFIWTGKRFEVQKRYMLDSKKGFRQFSVETTNVKLLMPVRSFTDCINVPSNHIAYLHAFRRTNEKRFRASFHAQNTECPSHVRSR